MNVPQPNQNLIARIWEMRFWWICGLIIILGAGTKWVATQQLDRERASQVRSIRNSFDSLTQITGRNRIANDEVESAMLHLIAARQRKVVDAWTSRYEQQRVQFAWPAVLGRDFLRSASQLPALRELGDSNNGTFHIGQREAFAKYVQRELPRLAEKARSLWNPENRPTAADPYVEWDAPSQAELLATNFAFARENANAPATQEMVCAHEDLCVLRTILTAIKYVNAPSDVAASMAVHNIRSIRIGRLATAGDQQLIRIGGNDLPLAQTRSDFLSRSRESDVSYQSTNRTYESSVVPTRANENPFDSRYVDQHFQPIIADKLAESTATAVVNRLPFRVKISVDQRRLTELLAEFANSTPVLEVHQFRMNPENKLDLSNPMDRDSVKFAYDIEIEVYGTVSIYQPVDLPMIRLAAVK